jgi:hypothetical protein
MAAIRVYEASNLSQLLNRVKAISNKWAPGPSDPEELWFRGDQQTFPLLPSLYRKYSKHWSYDEENLHERFRVRGTPYKPTLVQSEWDWYFLAQHHGLPTRLLDWTENVLVATYFAIAKTINLSDRTDYDKARESRPKRSIYDNKSPVIWVLDAGTLNVFSCKEDCVITVGGARSDLYQTSKLIDRCEANRYPIAILPTHSNERLAVQKGVFTIHGHENLPLDALVSSRDCAVRLAKIIIDRANTAHFWRELELLGVSESWLFPGLDSIANTVKWLGQGPP